MTPIIQKPLRKKIIHKLEEMVAAKAAPGFQLSLGFRDQSLGTFYAGIREPRTRRPVYKTTWFDLASLTKILVTVDLLMGAIQAKLLTDLSAPLKTWFPFFTSELKNQTILDLLNHCSGLPPVFEETEEFNSRSEKIRFFLKRIDETYQFKEERPTVYSDVGFMLLGILNEQIYSGRLSQIYSGRPDLAYGPIRSPWLYRFFTIQNIAAVQSLDEKPRWLKGEVQDPRAAWLEGDAGHAGLFGTSDGVENWGRELFQAYQGKGLRLSDKTVRTFINFDSAVKSASFLNGFDTPTEGASQAGTKFGKTTVGHLGYTGSSFWMDIEKGIRITLLSHRFAPGYSPETLRKWRPIFHDWLHAEVFSKFR